MRKILWSLFLRFQILYAEIQKYSLI